MHEPAHLSRRALAVLPLATLAGAAPAAASTTLAPALAADDAELLDVGRRWSAAWAELHEHDLLALSLADDDPSAIAEQEVIGDRLFAVEQQLYDDILASPVHTLQGLALKAQVVARAHDVMVPGIAPIEAELAHERTDLETHAALTLALDVLRLAGAAS